MPCLEIGCVIHQIPQVLDDECAKLRVKRVRRTLRAQRAFKLACQGVRRATLLACQGIRCATLLVCQGIRRATLLACPNIWRAKSA